MEGLCKNILRQDCNLEVNNTVWNVYWVFYSKVDRTSKASINSLLLFYSSSQNCYSKTKMFMSCFSSAHSLASRHTQCSESFFTFWGFAAWDPYLPSLAISIMVYHWRNVSAQEGFRFFCQECEIFWSFKQRLHVQIFDLLQFSFTCPDCILNDTNYM